LSDIRQTAESIFRREFGRIIARLIRASGSIEMAEDALQEAFASALAAWPEKGIPEDPAAWIIAVATRKLISAIRRENTKQTKRNEVSYERRVAQRTDEIGERTSAEHPDDRLRLIFTCCHPALHREGQIALTLRTLGGLTTSEIAKAFLVSESTIAQRLVRVKRKIREARIPYSIPTADQLPDRLASVQAVIYLIFNEGYLTTSGDDLIRKDLCIEAVRLGRLLCDLLPREPENQGLLALMLLNNSRAAARVNRLGELSPLEEQDRSLWNHNEIEEGLDVIENALSARRPGPYQLQAAIAALHAQARTPADTDWPRIAALYGKLLEVARSPVTALNHAAAVAMGGELEEALQMIDALVTSGRLDNYYLLHAARADILRRLGQRTTAAEAYSRALSLTANRVEQAYIRRRLVELADDQDFGNIPDATSSR